MRIREKEFVKLGDTFTKRKFLLIPKYIDGEWVWLETVLQTKEWSNNFFDTSIIDLLLFGGLGNIHMKLYLKVKRNNKWKKKQKIYID